VAGKICRISNQRPEAADCIKSSPEAIDELLARLPGGIKLYFYLDPSLNPVNPVKKLFSLFGCWQSPP
jgi:hypothetical protein